MFSFFSVFAFAAFPVETQILLTDPDTQKFKLYISAFILGILTVWLLPFSLLLLLIQRKNVRGSLAWGWLAGLVFIVLIVLLPEIKLIY